MRQSADGSQPMMYCWMGVFCLRARASTQRLPLSHLTWGRIWRGYQTIQSSNVAHRLHVCVVVFCTNTDEKHQLAPLMFPEKNHTQTHCRSFRACLSSQSLIISPTDVFWVFHMLQMKAICTHTGQSKHLLKGVEKKWPTTWRKPPRHAQAEQFAETLSAPRTRKRQRRRRRTGRGESSCQIRQRTEFPIRPSLNCFLGPFSIINNRRFVWPRRWSSRLTCRVLTYTEGCLTLAERRGGGGVGGGLHSPWIPGISGGYLSQALDSVIDNTPPHHHHHPKKKCKNSSSASSQCQDPFEPQWSFKRRVRLPEW